MRRIALFALVLAVAATALVRPAAAKLEGAEWTQAEKRFRDLFAKPGDLDGKLPLLKEVAKDAEPRAWKLLADGLVLESGHVAKTMEHYTKSLNRLQELLAKPLKTMYPADRDEMYQLQTNVGELEQLKIADEAVVSAIVAAFGTADEVGRRQLLAITKGHKEWPVRAIGARVAGGFPDEELAKAMLAEALSAKEDPRVKLAALEALRKASGSTWQDLVVARIEDSDWGVQLVAAQIAGDREVGKSIPTLIKTLATCSPRVAEDVVKALRKLTGQSMDAFPEPWAKWWEANRSKWGADGRPLQPVVDKPRPSDVEVYGLKVKSNRVLFVLDTSHSMLAEKQAPPAPPKPKGPVTGEDPKPKKEPEGKFSGPKIEIAKQELRRAVEKLTKDTYFNIIQFNHGVSQWKDKMMPADPKNKEEAFAWIRDMQPIGSTYIDGALRLAFKMAGMGAYDKAYPGVNVDTMIVLSDGAPTDNGYPDPKNMDPEEVLAHVREWNSQHRVIIHCIGIDNVVQGIEFMKKLAKENGGVYIDG